MELNEYNKDLIKRLIEVINMLDKEKWSRSISSINNETIGRHFRHISDFYIQFSKGAASKYIDYDARDRNEAVEVDPKAAIDVFRELINFFKLPLIENPIQITMNSSINNKKIESTMNRELMALIDHTIHHGHIIQIAIQNEFPEMEIKESFYSPSTIESLKCAQ